MTQAKKEPRRAGQLECSVEAGDPGPRLLRRTGQQERRVEPGFPGSRTLPNPNERTKRPKGKEKNR